MHDYSKKAILLGLGALEFTREKAQEFADELVKKGQLTVDEKAPYLDELMKEAEKREEQAIGKIKAAMRELINELGVVRKDDINGLEARLSRIEELLRKREDQRSQ